MFVLQWQHSWLFRVSMALSFAIALFFANTAQAAPGEAGRTGDAVKQMKVSTNFNGKTIVGIKPRRALKAAPKVRLARLLPRPRLLPRQRMAPRRGLSGRGTAGLNPRLRRLLGKVARKFGRPVVVSSGCRSYSYNRRIGGARRSLHVGCRAADFKVVGVSKARLRRYVASLSGRGGVGSYCGRSIVHLDVGPVRSWYQGCRKRKRSRKS